MTTVSTAPSQQDARSPVLAELCARGFFEQASDFAGLDASLARESVTFYVGFDPTASSLHVGNLLVLMAMRLFQRHGHRPICVIGGGTGLVGDPSGKTESRKLLDRDTIVTNVASQSRQLTKVLHFDRGASHDAMLLDNAEWLLRLDYIGFLRDIGSQFTVNRMIATKTYRDRLDAELPLSFIEFNYQIIQAYDFLELWRRHDCTLQLGGSDQWGNMVAGVELIRRVGNRPQRPAYCLTFPLLTTADGAKMGKTERGAVWLDAERFAPFSYYQYWIGCDDRDVEKLLYLYTELPLADIREACSVQGSALRTAKARLAFEATRLLHGEHAAVAAREASQQAFGDDKPWDAVPAVVVRTRSIKLVDLCVLPEVAAFRSKREARQRIEAGAVRLDGEPCSDPMFEITHDRAREPGLRLHVGKKTRVRIVLNP